MEQIRKTSKAKIGIGLGIIGVARWGGNPEFGRSVEGFKEGLAENGFLEGKNVRFIIENPETDIDKQRQIIQSFIQAKVDLIYSLTTPGKGPVWGSQSVMVLSKIIREISQYRVWKVRARALR